MSSKYVNEITLPSKGILYDESLKIPEKITIRAMTTKEEKMLLGSTSDAINDIIENCIEKPSGIKVDELISADVTNILVDLRVLTYGPEYKMFFICEACNKKNTISIDLTELYNRLLNDDFTEPIEIKLPRSGDVLEVKLLRGKDFKAVDKWAKVVEKRTKASNLKGDVAYTLRMAKYIKTINKEEVDSESALAYVEEMIGMDSAHFWKTINDIQMGYDINLTRDCMQCGHENEFVMPITAEFFRPSS